VYHVTPSFETATGGPGTVAVGAFIHLADPDHKIPWPDRHTGGDRPLTGADFDIESFRKAPDGSLWFGDQFGPFLVHTSEKGKVLEAPIPLPGVKSPEIRRWPPARRPSSPRARASRGSRSRRTVASCIRCSRARRWPTPIRTAA
jgi:glycerophosphoryl diester phosphodiesterase